MSKLKDLREQIVAAQAKLTELNLDPESEDAVEYQATIRALEAMFAAEYETVKNSGDIDALWDGTGSLDAHREKILATVKQPGFGAARLVKNGE